MMELKHKLVCHIPGMAWCGGSLETLPLDRLLQELANEFEQSGASGLYVMDAAGYYKGRSYPEKLVTVYCDDAGKYAEAFVNWFRGNNETLKQEALAYEMDGALRIEIL